MASRVKRARGGEGAPYETDQFKFDKMVKRTEVGTAKSGRTIVFTNPKQPKHFVYMKSGSDHVWGIYRDEANKEFYFDPNMGKYSDGSLLEGKDIKEKSMTQYPVFLRRQPAFNTSRAANEAGEPAKSFMQFGGMCDQVACAIAKVILAHPDHKKFLQQANLKELLIYSYDASAKAEVLTHSLTKAQLQPFLKGPVPAAYL
jgi:hypothetical protein